MSGKAIFLTAIVICWLLGGCMHAGPDFKPAGSPVPVPGAYQNAAPEDTWPAPADPWWHEFGRPKLDRIVERALANNLDIRKATANVLQLRSRFVQTWADRYPRLNLSAQAERSQQNFNFPSAGGSSERQSIETDSFNLALAASFEVDLWGRLARADEAARADLLAAEENRQTVAQTVAAEAVRLVLQIEALEKRLQIARRSVESFQNSLEFVTGRYELGLVSILDVRQSGRTLAQGEAVIPALRLQLGKTHQQLNVLLGNYPLAQSPGSSPALEYHELPPVPPGLPSQLLERRPDIRAAEARLRAANARIGVARANRFPRISLTAQYGYASSDLSTLLQPESEIYTLAANLAQTIFDAGKLKAIENETRAAYEQTATDYAAAVLNGFFDVESALLTRKEELQRLERVRRFRDEALETQTVAQQRYIHGLVDYLTVLDAQQTRFRAEDDVVLVELSLWTNRVALYRALGGGWGNPGPVPRKLEDLPAIGKSREPDAASEKGPARKS